MSTYLEALVIDRCRALGDKAAEFFGVSPGHVRQWLNGSKKPSLAAVQRVFVEPISTTTEASWSDKSVEICLPWYKSSHPLTTFSLLGLWDREKMGVKMDYGDAMIVHSRETLAHRFLQGGKPWSFWLDDDMIAPMGNASWYRSATGFNFPDEFAGLHTINRLLSAGETIVGGLYFGRKPHGRAMYYEALVDSPAGAAENLRAHSAPIDERKPVKWVGTGGILIHRQAFLDVQEKNPHLAPSFPGEPFHFFTNSSDGAHTRFKKIEEIVALAESSGEKIAATDIAKLLAEIKQDVLKNSHLMQGEDQTFGIRANLAGHQSFVDLGLVYGHVGPTVFGPHNTTAPSPSHVHN